MAVVWIPSLMRDLTGGQEQVRVPGKTVGQVLAALEEAYPGVEGRLCEGERLAPTLAVSVDGKIARLRLSEPVGEQSEIRFPPAIAGG
jgi:molybdopterin converting factor small subunit